MHRTKTFISTVLVAVTLSACQPVWPLPVPGFHSGSEYSNTAPVQQPVNGDCDSWAPLLAKHGIPYPEAKRIMWRESRCTNAVNLNRRTRDASYGPLQVNRYGSMAKWWDDRGYTLQYMQTPEGSVHAASVLYHACGWGPWTKPYSCWGSWPR